MKKYDIFPTPLWHIEGTPQKILDELYQGAYRFKRNYSDNQNKSNDGGYQSPMFGWDKFHPEGTEYINSIVDDILPEVKVNVWWYNINGKGHWNNPHTHADCNFALVWYLTDSDELLHLMSPFPQRLIDKKGELNVSIPAVKGDILIFPSDIMHFVKPNQKDTDRISISMNLQLC